MSRLYRSSWLYFAGCLSNEKERSPKRVFIVANAGTPFNENEPERVHVRGRNEGLFNDHGTQPVKMYLNPPAEAAKAGSLGVGLLQRTWQYQASKPCARTGAALKGKRFASETV